jgi:hypothetical protein
VTIDIQERTVSAEEFREIDLIMRILKLRWMGRESEAERMQAQLRCVDVPSLLADPADTD